MALDVPVFMSAIALLLSWRGRLWQFPAQSNGFSVPALSHKKFPLPGAMDR
jgi:hypothetical protein